MDRKLYGDSPPAGTVDQLPSVGDPEVTIDSQNNDHHYVYDTDAALEARDVLG
jgi:hypothetical protein